MNVARMRLLDRWLGVPACFALTRVRRVARLIRAERTGPPRRIALVKLAEQGATVLARAAIERAIEMVGRENLFFVVFEENRPILDLMDVIAPDNIIPIRTGNPLRVLADTLAAVRRLRREGVDAVVDLEFFARSSAAITYLSGARNRVGFHGYVGDAPYRGDLMTHRLSFNPHLHAAQVFLMQVEALAADPGKLPALDLTLPRPAGGPPTFQPSPDEVASVRRELEEQFGPDGDAPLVLLNANCSDLLPLRRWPEERYLELARRLLEKYPELRIAFTGAPSEAPPVMELVRTIGSPRCASMAGRTTLRELLVLYGLADVLVTNDSGPAHFASLTPIDVITMFGPETPAAFGVISPRSHILWAGLACSPCVNAYNNRLSACRDNICMKRIGVDRVFDEVCRAYEARRSVKGRT